MFAVTIAVVSTSVVRAHKISHAERACFPDTVAGADGNPHRMIGTEIVSYEPQQIDLPRIRADLASERSTFFAPRENLTNKQLRIAAPAADQFSKFA